MSSAARRPLRSLPPTETLEIGSGLSLTPRLKLLLTFFRSDPAVRPIDEWQLRNSLLDFLRSPSLSLTVPDDDLLLRKGTDLHKRKREDPVVSGTLFIRDLGFLNIKRWVHDEDDDEARRRRFLDWRSFVVEKLNEIELNLKGVRFKMTVEIPGFDDFDRMKKSWEDYYASQLLDNWNALRSMARQPDTIVIKGIPSRWFAEPRVSSKASMLVTHTIFSVLGNIRNLDVAGDDDLCKKSEDKREAVSGLQCKVWVQFESYGDFCNAMKVLCGRSMQKDGSRLKVDYEVTWDRDGYFWDVQQRTRKNLMQERGGYIQVETSYLKREKPRHQSHVTGIDSENSRSRRFRD